MRFLILILLSWPVSLFSQDLQVLLKEASAAEVAMHDDLAYRKYQEVLKIQSTNLTALCKCSELASKIGHRQLTKEVQIKYFELARRYAELALKLNPAYPDANIVMSLAMGRMALVASGRKQVEAVKDIKIYADKSVALNPADFRGYHILGRWYFEIANLGAFKRTAVKIFYGAFPDASFNDARKYYQKSMQLNPEFNLNYLELAKVFVKLDQPSEAVSALEKLMAMPLKMEDDKQVYNEGKKLIEQLKPLN